VSANGLAAQAPEATWRPAAVLHVIHASSTSGADSPGDWYFFFVGGKAVGSIQEISLGDHGQALVKFSVSSDYAPLSAGTTAQIHSTSLSSVAGRQIILTLPPSGGNTIADGGQIPLSQTTSEVDLDQIFNTLSPKTIADATPGKSKAGLVAALVAHEQSDLNQAVKDGRLTQAQATAMAANLEERITKLVDGTLPSHPDGAPPGDNDGDGPPPA